MLYCMTLLYCITLRTYSNSDDAIECLDDLRDTKDAVATDRALSYRRQRHGYAARNIVVA